MSNSLIIEEVLEKADSPLSGDVIWKRGRKRNSSLHRSTVSSILNEMYGKGKVDFRWVQVEDRRIKFWSLEED